MLDSHGCTSLARRRPKGRPGGGGYASSSKGGSRGSWKGDFRNDDWWCPVCSVNNFKRNLKCRRCGERVRPGAGADFGLPEGQWYVQ